MVSKNAIFLCTGDKGIFGYYVVENLLHNYDLIVNYFGSNKEDIKFYKKHSVFFQHKSNTKFLALKDIFNHNPSVFDDYENIVCFDDDATIINGSIDHLIQAINMFNMKIISPAHYNKGKISHNIMRTYPGNHLIRFTNFVEMTFPIFKKTFIIDYLSVYDGSCCGYGNDWWYMNLISNRGSNNDVGICDSVVVHNPKNSRSKNNISEYKSKIQRHKEWQTTKQQHNLSHWTPQTLAYVHNINNEIIMTPTTMMP
jgi:hypothetical protein